MLIPIGENSNSGKGKEGSSSSWRSKLLTTRSQRNIPGFNVDDEAWKWIGSVTSLSFLAYVIYHLAKVALFEYRLSSGTMMEDSAPFIADEDRIDQTDEKKRIKQLIMNPSSSKKFHVYTGPHRAGKSQAIKEVVDELHKEGVKGVHYITADKPLYKSLVYALSMDDASVMKGFWAGFFDLKSPFPDQQTPEEALKQVTDRLAKSAKKYKNGRLTTIIIDGVNNLLPYLPPSSHLQGPETAELHRMIGIAKRQIDDRQIHWILVDSSGVAFEAMYATSGSSRLEMILSNDVSEKAAKEYLMKRFQAAGKSFDVDRVYNCVTGGRIGLLNDVADNVKQATTEEKLFAKVLKEQKNSPFSDLCKVFRLWPHTKIAEEEFQYRIIRHLAESPKEKEEITVLRTEAGEKKTKFEEVNCDAAIRALFKADLLRHASGTEVALHSNAVKHLILTKGQPLTKDEK